jgi:DNA recombination protein RmuC
MDHVLFSIDGVDIGVGLAAIILIGAAGALLAIVMMTYFRGERARLEDMAEVAKSALRTNFKEHLDERERQVRELKQQLAAHADTIGDLQETNSDLRARSAAIEAQMTEQARQEAQNLERFMAARQQMTDEFKVLAGDVLKTHGETFSKQNREQVDLLLKPLGEKIVEFQTGLLKDRAELGARIQHLTMSSLTMSQEANALTRALKGNAQVQGAWGEMILSTILKNSGLREGEQFRTQQSHTADDGARVRTDVEILLPNGDVMIVDSKVSLTAFEALVNATGDLERAQQLKAHTASMRTHIKTLAGKQYQRHAKSGLDFVFMFVPIEAAFSAAVTAEPDLIEFAMAQGVLLTTPTTLLSALRTVANVWDIEKRQQNAEQIAERAGALYDKVVGFLDKMDQIGTSLDRTRGTFNDARNLLAGGKGSVVRQVEMLRELGAKTSKQLPPGWSDGNSDVVPITANVGSRANDRSDGDFDPRAPEQRRLAWE